MPYFGAVTGEDGELGINGALMQRQGPPPETNQALNGYACTMGVESYDVTEAKFLKTGQSSHAKVRITRNGMARLLY